MAYTREKLNRIKIEHWRIPVPIANAAVIYQGDMAIYNAHTDVAAVATAASGGTFIGVFDGSNPIETAGSPSFLADSSQKHLNVVQSGLVEMIADGGYTCMPFDSVYIGNTDAQHVTNSGSFIVGIIDPKWAGSAGRAVVLGDLVRFWLRVPQAYRALG
jgi:hypothetical protein